MNDTISSDKPTVAAKNGSSGTQLLDKALDMVELVANTSQRLTAQDISVETGYSKPTTYRILAALVRRGMLTLDERDQAYELGLRFADLTTNLRASHRFLMLIERDLISLSARTGETVTVGIAEKDAVRIVSRYRIGFEVESGASRGSKRPYHASGIGKAALAWIPERDLPQYLKRIQFQRLTTNTLQTAAALKEDLRLIRARGYAIDNEEIIDNVRCVARPLLDRDGRLIGSISLSAPSFRMPPERLQQYANALGNISNLFTLRFSGPHRHSDSGSSLRCIHEGGLFHPIAIGGVDGSLLVVDAMGPAIHQFTPDGVLFETQVLPMRPVAAAISATGRIVLAAPDGRLFERQSEHSAEIPFPHTGLTDLAFDGTNLLATTAGDDPGLWDVHENRQIASFEGPVGKMACCEGEVAIAAAEGGRIDIYSSTDGRLIERLEDDRQEEPSSTLAFGAKVLYSIGAQAGYLKKITRDDHHTEYLALPERHVSTSAILADAVYLAGANLKADLGGDSGIPGSLYRLPA